MSVAFFMRTGTVARHPDQEKGVEFFQHHDRAKVERQLIERLERLGYHVTRPPQPAA